MNLLTDVFTKILATFFFSFLDMNENEDDHMQVERDEMKKIKQRRT